MMERKIFIGLGLTLLLSLAGNFFLAGLYFGARSNDDLHAVRRVDRDLREKIPAPDRALIKQAMDQHRPRFQQARRELEAARENVARVTQAEPLDPAALESALAQQQEKEDALRDMMRVLRRETASKLSPEGRRLFMQPEGFRREFHNRPRPAPQTAP